MPSASISESAEPKPGDVDFRCSACGVCVHIAFTAFPREADNFSDEKPKECKVRIEKTGAFIVNPDCERQKVFRERG